jgi:adenosylcobinamide kinase / adenosylcobinamide-phosphate guanylyltransferase
VNTKPEQFILVTGPARSGKSEWAEFLATQSGKSVVYVATAQANPADQDWQARIAQHQLRRPLEWVTRQVPLQLSAVIQASANTDCLLIDSLGTWLANVIDQDELLWEKTERELLQSVGNCPSLVIMVAEETGWGVVPAYPTGRVFRDRLGTLVRKLSAIAQTVYLVTAGHVLDLSVIGTPLSRALVFSSDLQPPDL